MDIVVRSFCKGQCLKHCVVTCRFFVSQKLMTGFRLQLTVKISNMRCRVRSILVRACRTQLAPTLRTAKIKRAVFL